MAKREVVGFVAGNRKARRSVERELAKERRRASEITEGSTVRATKDLEQALGRLRHGPRHTDSGAGGFWSPARVNQPGHRFSSLEAAGIYPFLTGSRRVPLGAPLGVDRETQDLWCFDPWKWYEHGRIPSTGILVMGGYRQGKSWFLKRLIETCVAMGRQAINTSDSKGEHARLAEALGGTVFRVGAPGSQLRINPLDAGTRPVSEPEEVWDLNVRQRRSLLLQQIIEILLGTRQRLAPEERTALEWALEVAVKETDGNPTIRRVYENLGDLVTGKRDSGDTGDIRDEAKRMWHTLRRLIVGDLSGMFEDESTVKLDADSPYTVFDTYSMANRGEDALTITQAVTQSWVQSILQDKASGRKFIIAREEGWRDMNSASALESQRLQQKLAGEYGICQLLVVHEGGDFEAVGDAGSKERELAEQLAKGFAVKISFAQEKGQLAASASAVGLTPSQTGMIASLNKGECVVAIGESTTLVDTYPLTTDWERKLFDTDAAMRDREATEELLEHTLDDAPTADGTSADASTTDQEPTNVPENAPDLVLASTAMLAEPIIVEPALTPTRASSTEPWLAQTHDGGVDGAKADVEVAAPANPENGGIGSGSATSESDSGGSDDSGAAEVAADDFVGLLGFEEALEPDTVPPKKPVRKLIPALVTGVVAVAAAVGVIIGTPAVVSAAHSMRGDHLAATYRDDVEMWAQAWTPERMEQVLAPDPASVMAKAGTWYVLDEAGRESVSGQCQRVNDALLAADALEDSQLPALEADDKAAAASTKYQQAVVLEASLAPIAEQTAVFGDAARSRLDAVAALCAGSTPFLDSYSAFQRNTLTTMPAARVIPTGGRVQTDGDVYFPCESSEGCVDLFNPQTRELYAAALETTYVGYFTALAEAYATSCIGDAFTDVCATGETEYQKVADEFAKVVDHLRSTAPMVSASSALYPELPELLTAANSALAEADSAVVAVWAELDPTVSTLADTGASLARQLEDDMAAAEAAMELIMATSCDVAEGCETE